MNWRLRRTVQGFGFWSWLLLLIFPFAATRASILSPERGAQISLVIGDIASPYFKLVVDSSTYVSATGPGELKFVVRFSIPSGARRDARFGVKVSDGATEVAKADTTVAASDATWQSDPSRPSEPFRIVVKVPEGDHRYRVDLTSPVKSFAGVRYLFSTSPGRQPKSPVYPVDMAGTTSISMKEKLVDFFLADSTRPVKVRVIGPTRLRIVTRLAYSGVMKGTQKYSVQVSMDSKPTAQQALETSKSPATYFTNHKEWSVGESQTVYTDIPEGTHEVSVILRSTSAPALAVRFTIPKEDVGK